MWQQLRSLLNLDPACLPCRGMKRARIAEWGDDGAGSALCNNKLLGGPINQTQIASVDGAGSVTMRR